jgi:hypothetical protein
MQHRPAGGILPADAAMLQEVMQGAPGERVGIVTVDGGDWHCDLPLGCDEAMVGAEG